MFKRDMKVRFKRLDAKAVIPTKKYESDFCYDVTAVSREEIAPNVYRYGLGFALQLEGTPCVAAITFRPRSSVWKTGMVLSNSVGTIDRNYTGEITAVFYHVMPTMPAYEVGDRIGQIHVDMSVPIKFKEVADLRETDRGDNGYGSTGR